MTLKPSRFLKSNSGSSIIQATIAASVAFIVLYAMTSSMINLNRQSNVVNLKMEVSNLSNQLEAAFSRRTSCTANLLNNNIRFPPHATPKYTFDAAGKALGFYSAPTSTTPSATIVPLPAGSKLEVDFAGGRARFVNPVPPVAPSTRWLVDLEVRFTHKYPGLLVDQKPILVEKITVDVDAGGVALGCQLTPRVQTVGCEYQNRGLVPTTSFNTGAAVAADACENATDDGTTWKASCKLPAFTLGGCSSSNLKVFGTTISNVTVQNNGCSVPISAVVTSPPEALGSSSKLFITCVGSD